MYPNRRRDPARSPKSGDDKGFTLIELLVVITILGILAAIVVFAVNGIGDKGKANSVATDASVLRTAEEAYCAQNGSYTDITGLKTAKLLTTDAASTATDTAYNTLKLGAGHTCGQGSNSSFAIFHKDTTFVPGKDTLAVGHAPVDIAVDSTNNRIYVVNTGDSPATVSVIDGADDSVVGPPIPVGHGDVNDRIAVNPNNHKVYVSNTTDKSISVIDTQNNDQVDAVPFTQSSGGAAATPGHLLADPNTGDVYVEGSGVSGGIMVLSSSDSPSWINFGSGTAPGSGTTGMAIDTVADKIYAPIKVSATSSALIQIDGSAHTFHRATMPAQTTSGYVAVDSTRHRIYTTGLKSATSPKFWRTQVTDGTNFSDTNAATTFVDETATVPQWNLGLAVNQDTGTAFVAGFGPNTAKPTRIGLFDGGTATYGPQVDLGLIAGAVREHSLALNPSSDRVYFIQSFVSGDPTQPGGLQVFDASTQLPSTIGAGRAFGAIAVNPATNKIYATDTSGNAVAALQ